MNGDVDPYYDTCSDNSRTSTGALGVMSGENIGDLLNAAHVTWGWFQGGFAPTANNSARRGLRLPARRTSRATTETDYSPHHEPFQYFASTANPHHLPPSSPSMIGQTDQANHQYDLSYFWIAADSGRNLPAVSYLKAPSTRTATRLLRPARRADVAGQHNQPAQSPVLDVDRDNHRLGRLGRLV